MFRQLYYETFYDLYLPGAYFYYSFFFTPFFYLSSFGHISRCIFIMLDDIYFRRSSGHYRKFDGENLAVKSSGGRIRGRINAWFWIGY